MPIAGWHVKAAVLLGSATLFDAYDALTIAYILPSLIVSWKITVLQASSLIAFGYVGQAIGALGFGMFAERNGRIAALTASVALIGIMSLLAAFALDYRQLLVARFIQGIGLGGEVPVAATYLNEIVQSKRRGKIFLLYQSTFGLGMAVAAVTGALFVQRFGWKPMFFIGSFPILLSLLIPILLPESPRWLAGRGRSAEAGRKLSAIERSIEVSTRQPLDSYEPVDLPSTLTNQSTWRELFSDRYRGRTVGICLLWISAYACTYSIAAWLPTLLTRFYGLPLQLALEYAVLTSIAGAFGCVALATVVDRLRRQTVFLTCFVVTAAATGMLGVLNGGAPATFIILMSITSFFLLIATGALYLYTPELFPTRIRAMGTGFASFCLRLTAIATPFGVGILVTSGYIRGFYWALFGLAVAGIFSALRASYETAGKILENVSP